MNRIILLTFLIFLVILTPSAAADQGRAEILHHDIHLVLSPEQGMLEGVDTLTMALGGAREVQLSLAPTVVIETVILDGKALPYVLMAGRLAVRLPVATVGRKAKLQLNYSGVFRDQPPEDPVSAEDPTYGVAATIQPQGVFLGGGSGWYPDIPGSRATFRLRVETPAEMTSVTSGRRLEQGAKGGRNYAVWETAAPLPSLTLAAGPFRRHEEQAEGIPIATYFYPETEQLAAGYLQASAGYLRLYQGLFGPYPFEKFAVVENFFPTGYGFPSWTLIGSTVVRLPFIVETSLGHEIAHSWWGNGVLVDYARGNWSEGLTTYVADHLFKERTSAAEGRDYRLKILRDYATLVAPDEDYPLRRFSSRRSAVDQAVGYGKAAMVFHMARRLVGEQAFWSALRELAGKKMFQSVSWDDFSAALGRAGGRDLDGFFRQWIEWTGAPRLHLEDVLSAPLKGRWRVSGTLVQDAAATYELQVPLRLEAEGRQVTELITTRERRTPFIFEIAERPLRLVVDPEVDLLRRLDPSEIPSTVNSIRGSGSLVVILAKEVDPTDPAVTTLLGALQQQGARMLGEAEASAGDLDGHDLLFLGLPRRMGLISRMPEGLRITADGFSLNGESYSRTGATLFAAFAIPSTAGRSAAIFLPGSGDEAKVAARKIPHYGKYSFLVFSDGRNKVKGTWPAAGSPLVIQFAPVETPP